MAYNKVVYGKDVLIDLTRDTVTEDVLLFNKTAHDKSGNEITGTLFRGYPNEVQIPIVQNVPVNVIKKEKNIIQYDGKTLVDLSKDTVEEETLLYGYQCHKKSGEIINGSFLSGYPTTIEFHQDIQDSSGASILDSLSNNIVSQIIYKKGETVNNRLIYKK